MARESFSKIAFKTLQQSKSIAGFAHKQISSRLMNFILPDSKLENFNVDKDLLIQIQNSMDILREEDWNDAEKNIYPKKLLFDEPWLRYLTQYPKIWLDMPNTWDRRRKQNFDDLPKSIDKDNYPQYYLRNFHHQTDGYLSDFSASIYDLQVEILFNGSADAMRRRIIKPLKEGLINFCNRKKTSLKKLGEEVILNLLMRVFQRSDEGALKRASEEKGLLLVHMHPKRMQKELPFIKSEWIRDGDTQQFLKYLGNLSKEVWTASFVKYKGIEFTSISKNDEI